MRWSSITVFTLILLVFSMNYANGASDRSMTWTRPVCQCSWCNASFDDRWVNTAGDTMTGRLNVPEVLGTNWIGTNQSLIYNSAYTDYSTFTRSDGHDGGVIYTDMGHGLVSEFGFVGTYYFSRDWNSHLYIDSDYVYFQMSDGSYPFVYNSLIPYTSVGTNNVDTYISGRRTTVNSNLTIGNDLMAVSDYDIGFDGWYNTGNITFDDQKDTIIIRDKTNVTSNLSFNGGLISHNNNSMIHMTFGKPSGTSEYYLKVQKYLATNPIPTLKSNVPIYFMPENILSCFVSQYGLSYIDNKGMSLGSAGGSRSPNIYGSQSYSTNGTASRYMQNLYIGVTASDYSAPTYSKSYLAMLGVSGIGAASNLGHMCNWKIQARKTPTLIILPSNCTSSRNFLALSYWNNQTGMIEAQKNGLMTSLVLNGSKINTSSHFRVGSGASTTQYNITLTAQNGTYHCCGVGKLGIPECKKGKC